MFKLKHSCAVSAIFGVFFVIAGCASQDVVRKEEGIAPVRPVGPETPAKPSETLPAKQDVKAPSITQTTPPQPTSSGDESQKTSLTALQAALETIYFAYDSSALSETARAQLRKDADLLKEKSAKVRIEGHCDERGSAEYNLALGERRAQAAHQYLITLGIKPERLSIISYGKEKPAVRGDNETAWMKNRRAEFIVQQ